jgi:hypothetical protein
MKKLYALYGGPIGLTLRIVLGLLAATMLVLSIVAPQLYAMTLVLGVVIVIGVFLPLILPPQQDSHRESDPR